MYIQVQEYYNLMFICINTYVIDFKLQNQM